MMYKYRNQWMVKCWWIENEPPNHTRLVVNIYYRVDDADPPPPEGPPPITKGCHTFEYEWVDNEGRFRWCVDLDWSETSEGSVHLGTVDNCVYDACCRFEIHELKHWLRDMEGNHLVHPHPGAVEHGSDDTDAIQSDEPRLQGDPGDSRRTEGDGRL